MSEEQPQENEPRSSGSFESGFKLLLLLHLLQIPMTWLSHGISLWAIGVTQLLYVIPALVVLILKKRSETAKGVGLIAGITLLLNATCAGIVYWWLII